MITTNTCPRVPRFIASETHNDPAEWNTVPHTKDDVDFHDLVLSRISTGASIKGYAEAKEAFERYMDNSGDTLIVSAKKFYDEAADFKRIIDLNTERIKLIAANEIRGGRNGEFSMITNLWREGSVSTPENWRGIYRGYEYYISGRFDNGEVCVSVTVFKQYNFDPGETYGAWFDYFNATGDTLNDLYKKGLACNMHIWSRMIRYSFLDVSTGNLVHESQWSDSNNSIIKALPGYRGNYK